MKNKILLLMMLLGAIAFSGCPDDIGAGFTSQNQQMLGSCSIPLVEVAAVEKVELAN